MKYGISGEVRLVPFGAMGNHEDRIRQAALLMDIFRLLGSTFFFITALIPFILGTVPFPPPDRPSQAWPRGD